MRTGDTGGTEQTVSMCGVCDARALSVCGALDATEQGDLANILEPVALEAGDILFEEGNPATRSFSLASGCLKLYKLLPDGRRLITDFLFVGDFLGLADTGAYTCTAEAITPATLCRFDRSAMENLVERQTCLERNLLDRARAELAGVREQLLLLGQKTARERVASFLLSLSVRAVQRGNAASPVDTPMRRSDMAEHLGLTTETISRTLTTLNKAGLIGREGGRRIVIRDREKLTRIAAGL